MICYDRLWKTLIDKHLKKTELRDKIGISNATLAKLGKNEPVNLKVIDAICRELNCDVEDVLEKFNVGIIERRCYKFDSVFIKRLACTIVSYCFNR